jgi:ferredoxin
MADPKDIILSLNVRAEQILQERFTINPPASASLDSSRCTVGFSRSGRTYLCSSADTLLAIAERHEIDVPSSCRVGRCGTCATRVLDGDVEVEIEDGLETGSRGKLQSTRDSRSCLRRRDCRRSRSGLDLPAHMEMTVARTRMERVFSNLITLWRRCRGVEKSELPQGKPEIVRLSRERAQALVFLLRSMADYSIRLSRRERRTAWDWDWRCRARQSETTEEICGSNPPAALDS